MSSKDTTRLDWLESSGLSCERFVMDDPNGEPSRVMWQCAGIETSRPTLREAIDASMPQEKPIGGDLMR